MKLTLLKIFTILWLMGMYLMLMATFITAYGSPQKAVRVDINAYQEANLEMAMLLGAFFASFVGAGLLISDIRKEFLQRSPRMVPRS
jgi:heme/copper-type cytochrome/quinol oxidase subunit 1